MAVGEASYTHATNWPNTQPYLPADQLSIIQSFKAQGIPVVVLLVLPRPYDLGATAAERTTIRNDINAGQPPPTNFGNPLYPYGAGLQGW